MSLDELVAEAGRALGGARSLFGPAPADGGWSSTRALSTGREAVGQAISAAPADWSGGAAQGYGIAAGGQQWALDSTIGADKGTGPPVTGSGQAAADGGGAMDGVIGDARSGVAAIAPSTGTPAGNHELVRHLQGQLDRAKDLLKVSEQRNMALAALIERGSAGYNPMAAANPMGGGMGGGMPMGLGGGGGGGLGSGMSIPGLDSLSSLTGLGRDHHHDPNAMLDAHDAAISGGSPLAQIAVKEALTKLGKPYVWGAKGPNEFDCSGLTHWAYAQAGITLGPDTFTQIHNGPAVPHGHVEAGDLIFPEPGHVMLAISPTQVVEAQQSGVPVEDLADARLLPSAPPNRLTDPLLVRLLGRVADHLTVFVKLRGRRHRFAPRGPHQVRQTRRDQRFQLQQ